MKRSSHRRHSKLIYGRQAKHRTYPTTKEDLKKILWIPDTHVPYEDAQAFELMLTAMRWWKPDVINILGDFGDFYAVSSHSKDPRRSNQLKNEVYAINERLDQIDALGAAEKHFVEGNHEDRLRRYLQDKAPEMFGLVGVEKLFNLTSRGYTFTPYKESRLQGKIHVTHDCGNAGAYAHYKALEAFEDNAVMGHTHRMAVAYVGNAQGKTHVGAMFGWLGDMDKIDYMHKIKALRAWQLGFGIGYQTENEVVHVQAIPIIDYSLVLEGRIFRG